jgi:hypothetical protein
MISTLFPDTSYEIPEQALKMISSLFFKFLDTFQGFGVFLIDTIDTWIDNLTKILDFYLQDTQSEISGSPRQSFSHKE